MKIRNLTKYAVKERITKLSKMIVKYLDIFIILITTNNVNFIR